MPEQEVIFYESDRKLIKDGLCNPSDTRGLIEALEAVAMAAIAYRWDPTEENKNALHDALARVDWMQNE